MDRPTCATCPFFVAPPPRNLYGQCHANSVHDWPSKQDADFCGQHPDFPAYIASNRSKPAEPEPVGSRFWHQVEHGCRLPFAFRTGSPSVQPADFKAEIRVTEEPAGSGVYYAHYTGWSQSLAIRGNSPEQSIGLLVMKRHDLFGIELS